MIGVGILGCGFVAFRHALAVGEVARTTELPVRLAAVCDPAPQRAATFSETFDVEATSDVRELLSNPDVTAVYVCTPTSTHLPLVRQAAEAGKAVFCEKPLGRDLEEAEAVVEAAEGAGVPNQVGLVLRSSWVYQALRSFLADLGPLMAVVFRDDQHWPLERHYGSTWRADPATAGGGTLLEHSIHDLDLIRWLFGEPEVVGAVVRESLLHPGLEDLAAALLEVPGGPAVSLTSLWHEMDDRRSERHLEVLGRRGRVLAQGDFHGTLELQGEAGPPRLLEPPEVFERAASDLELDEAERHLWRVAPLEDYRFLASLATGTPPSPSMREGLEAHRLVDRVYRAASSG